MSQRMSRSGREFGGIVRFHRHPVTLGRNMQPDRLHHCIRKVHGEERRPTLVMRMNAEPIVRIFDKVPTSCSNAAATSVSLASSANANAAHCRQ